MAEHSRVRRPRKDALYSREEMIILNKHKEEYRQQTSQELRANVFRTKILVDIGNYWIDNCTLPNTDEETVQRTKVSQNKFRCSY